MCRNHDPLRQRETLTPPPQTGEGKLPGKFSSPVFGGGGAVIRDGGGHGLGMITTRSLDCASLRSASLGITGLFNRHPDRSAAEWRGLIMLLP